MQNHLLGIFLQFVKTYSGLYKLFFVNRTLLQGVEDLRNLASTLDQAGPSGQHLSPPRQSPHHEFDPEDRAGPAL